jgi:hypothetical protein
MFIIGSASRFLPAPYCPFPQAYLLPMCTHKSSLPYSSLSPAISSSLLSTSTLLGFSTLRLFLGSQSTLTLLGNRGPAGWPLWSWLILPVVPYVQIGHAFAIDILGLEKWSVSVLNRLYFSPDPSGPDYAGSVVRSSMLFYSRSR